MSYCVLYLIARLFWSDLKSLWHKIPWEKIV